MLTKQISAFSLIRGVSKGEEKNYVLLKWKTESHGNMKKGKNGPFQTYCPGPLCMIKNL